MKELYTPVRISKKRLFKFSIVLGLLSLCLVNKSICVHSYTYTGPNNGNWSNTANWSGGNSYPGTSGNDDITISSNVNINVDVDVTKTLSAIAVSDAYTATLTIAAGNGVSVSGATTIGNSSATNFTITGPGSATLSDITFGYQSTFTIGSSSVTTTNVTINSGTVSMTKNSDVFTNYGVLTANSTTMTLSGGPSNFTNSGTVNLNSTSAMNFSANTSYLANTGNFNATSASISFSSNAGYSGINNNSPGVFTASKTTLSFQAGSGNSINNTGTFNATLCPITFGGGPSTFYNTGGTLEADGCTVSLSQSSGIQNSGTCTLQASGTTATTVNFAYGAYVSNTGTFYAGKSNSQCILNLTNQAGYVSNSGAAAKFYVGSTSIIYPSGVSGSVPSTSITNTSGLFTLQSDQYGSAEIGPFSSSSSSTGTFSVERFFQGGVTKSGSRWVYRNYRILSSPVNTGTKVNSNYIYGLNYIVGTTAGSTTGANTNLNAFVTGAAGGSTTAGNPSLFLYRESITPSDLTYTSGNFIGITDITTASAMHTSDGATNTTIPIGNAVFFFYRGNASNFTSRTTSPYVAPEVTTLTSTGNLNTQAVTVHNWYTPTLATLGYTITGTNANVRGFNMVGNPYACSIDWNTAYSGSGSTGIVRTKINPTIWVFNPFTNQYDTYLTTSAGGGTSNGGGTDGSGYATNIIASGQGFFVQANALSPKLVFNESAKSATSQVTGNNLFMGTPATQSADQLLRLRVIADSLNYDDITIRFSSTASPQYNGDEDAEYFAGSGAAEGLSSLSCDSVPTQLSINSLPLPKQTPQVIRLNVTAPASGTFTFKRMLLDPIPQIYQVWLMDRHKKDSLDLRSNNTYAFDINLADTASFGSNRFSIVIRQNPVLGVHLLNFTATKATGGAQIIWKTENEQNYTNFTLERSINNGASFDVLGGVLSSGSGTYSFLDKDPKANDQYRLKIEDLNGTITYSNVVTLDYSGSANSLVNNMNVYPNPATNYINLAIAPNTGLSSNLSALQTAALTPGLVNNPTNMHSYSIKIISITGTVIKTAISSLPDWHDNVSNLTPGTYIIQVTNNIDNSVVGKSSFIKL